jgi:hypothetical protein
MCLRQATGNVYFLDAIDKGGERFRVVLRKMTPGLHHIVGILFRGPRVEVARIDAISVVTGVQARQPSKS